MASNSPALLWLNLGQIAALVLLLLFADLVYGLNLLVGGRHRAGV